MYTIALSCERVVGTVACSQPCGYGQLQEKEVKLVAERGHCVVTNHNDGEDY